jgi:histidine ammonia-lyase
MKPEIEALVKASGCADVGELLDRMLSVGRVLHQFKQENGRIMDATELRCLQAVLGATPPEKNT